MLLLKLTLTPLLVALVTLVSRKWGAAIGGLVAGLPLTSGPVSLFLAVEHGPEFAAAATVGTLLGLVGVTTYVLTYGALAQRFSWPLCVLAGTTTFALMTVVVTQISVPLAVAALAAVGAASFALYIVPRSSYAHTPRIPKRWDIPVRIVIATSLVVVLTQIAPMLGPRLAGAVSPFPVFVTVLAVFTHREDGPAAAGALLRGVLTATMPYVAFFLVIGMLVEFLPVYIVYVTALVVAGLIGVPALAPTRGRPVIGKQPKHFEAT